MSRTEADRLSPLDRARLTAYLEADLAAYREKGAAGLADYCEDLLDMIREGAFDQGPARGARREAPRSPQESTGDGRYHAGQRWFLEKLEPTLARRDR